jgi:putative phage-type endonuclease
MSKDNPFAGPETSTLADLGIVNGNPHAVVLTCAQHDQAWFDARLGIPTASKASKLVTSTGKATTGQTRQSYICGLVAERLLGFAEPNHETTAMQRGTNLEPRARDWYAFKTGRLVKQVGFVYGNAARQYGCSPDGLCGDRVLEIKCPLHRTMIDILIGGKVPTDYAAQVQFAMWVTGLPLCDFVVFTPEPQIPSVVWTVPRDSVVQSAFDEIVPAVCAEIDAMVKRIKATEE